MFKNVNRPSALIILLTAMFLLTFTAGCSDVDKTDDIEPEVIALINGIIIDGTGTGPLLNSVIIIRSGYIDELGPSGGIDIPVDANIIDNDGGFILPGFFNTHVHSNFNEYTLQTWAKAGVTTVRDLGYFNSSSFNQLFSQRDAINSDITNARLVAAGPLVTTIGGYGNYEIASPEDARQKVLSLIGAGADLIKIAIEDDLQGRTWPILTMDEITAIVNTAHENNVPVSAHVSRSRHLAMAVEAGVDDLAHMIIDFLPDSLIDGMIAKNIYWVPTLELWEGVSDLYSINWADMAINNLERFINAGGSVAIGTDFGGYITEFDSGMPISEIRLMESAGMSPAQIIVAGTRDAAHVSNLEDQLGTIEPGKIADMIILEDNPLVDIEALLSVQAVIHNGVLIHSDL